MKDLRLAIWLLLSATPASFPLFAQTPQAHASACSEATVSIKGAWQQPGGDTQVLFTDDQIVIRKVGALSVATILSREPCKLVVRYQGLRAPWALSLDHGILQLQADKPLSLQPLTAIPAELDIDSPVLPAPGQISAAEVKEVEQELARRTASDQAALKDPALKAKRSEIIADNLHYLRDVTHRVGWIDIPRFGKDSAEEAILIAKHGSDLLLMKAALPVVERDVKEHGGSGEMFSVLYDELQITLGHQQRYGTQFMADAKGHPFILPLENPAKVDDYRKEIHILSFGEYRKLVSDSIGGGTLRLAGSDE